MLSGLLQPEKVLGAFEHQGRAAHSEESWLALMPDAELKYSLNAVKRAGKILRAEMYTWDELIAAQEILENWHACHSYPLNLFYLSLAYFAREQSPLTNVVQRRKRQPAIIAKLKSNLNIQLTTMQDIAGCRAITKGVSELESLVSRCREVWTNHELYDTDDYIATPKPSGYRGIHLIYRFQSDKKAFNGRFVEIQFRSRFQHAWATAVEIVDLFQGQSLKAEKGEPRWQRFFALMGSAIARIERTQTVPGTPIGREGKDLQDELRHYAEELKVISLMRAYGSVTRSFSGIAGLSGRGVSGYSSGDASEFGYFMMQLDADLETIHVTGYKQGDVQKAYRDVAEAERSGNPNIVLVAATDLDRLKDAYPNWLIDTHNFIGALRLTLDTQYW